MLGKGIRYYISVIRGQKRPLRFLVAQALRQTGLSRCFTIKRRYYTIQFHPTAYSANIWVNPEMLDRDEDFLASYLREGDTMIDIGANIGTMTLAAAATVGKTGAVYSVEAHPRTFKYLEQNIHRNGFVNVNAFNYAIGHEQGMISFSDKRADDTNAVVEHSDMQVPVITLDALLSPRVEKVNLLKIDVEGYERFVCLGAQELLNKTDCIYFECYESNFRNFGYSTDDLLGIIRSAGFTVVCNTGPGTYAVLGDFESEVCQNLVAVRDTQILSTRLSWTAGGNSSD